jgi:hypothetical protein
LSVAQAQVLGILRDVYAFMYAFSIQTVAVSQLHKQLAETKDIEMARKANGQGHTYKVGNSYRTVIRKGDHCITAMAATAQESLTTHLVNLKKDKFFHLHFYSISCDKGQYRSQ